MSFESRSMIEEDNNNDQNFVAAYQRNTYFGSTVQYTSSMVVDIRQLQADLQVQHQQDKETLIELNQRFHLFIDRIQLLQSQNEKYRAAIIDIRQQSSDVGIDVQWEESYFSSQSNLSTARSAIVDYQWDFELFQLQAGIYQQLIEIEQQPKNKRISMLEEELKQSASVLMTLRTSYENLQRDVENFHAESEGLLKEYLTLTYDWCNIQKQRKKWDLNVETLKSYIGFYKNLRSDSMRGSDSLSIQTDDMTQFWALELEKVVKRIRRDFEAFYATIHQDMIVYYETKAGELESNIKQTIQYQEMEMEQLTITQQKLTIEYEQVYQTYSYEKEMLVQLETTYSKVEAEFKSIQLEQEEQFEMQSNDIENMQESIMTMAYDVEEIRRSKASLEIEIIIYRQLLEAVGIEVPGIMSPRTQSGESRIMKKIAIKKQKRGPVGIKECAPNGTYISLGNYSMNNSVDLSKWILTRHSDAGMKIRYIIPHGVLLEHGRELRIYAKLNGAGESTSYQKLVNNNLDSWGEGNSIETYLFNQNGEEEASYTQLVIF